ncbi:MAG TPA: pyridoxamine 5'-phosphate oxidase family protein [Bacteroidales bacterium]|nr:pyridoxamine 5'-phosphate oxidase family protein [Bacteroidales bacterium]
MRTVSVSDLSSVEEIIKSCDICNVGMVDSSGVPYVLPMNFGYKEGVIYLHSAQEGSSVSMLEVNPNVCITFCSNTKLVWQNEEVACSYRMRCESAICHGKVVFEEDFDEKVKALNIIMSQYSSREFNYSDPSVNNVKIWKVAIDKHSAKKFGVPGEKASVFTKK